MLSKVPGAIGPFAWASCSAAGWSTTACAARRSGAQPLALPVVWAAVFAVRGLGLCELFSGRGAFIMFGAALGTIMVANVFFVIIPGQRELVRAKQQGASRSGPGLRGKQRSVHNTYFTLPVLFVMISNHYAMTYGAHDNWLVLIAHQLRRRLHPRLVRRAPPKTPARCRRCRRRWAC
jgi:uncharacterized membrane protein